MKGEKTKATPTKARWTSSSTRNRANLKIRYVIDKSNSHGAFRGAPVRIMLRKDPRIWEEPGSESL